MEWKVRGSDSEDQSVGFMIFKETELPGVYIIELVPVEDERGFFGRTGCQREFEARGLNWNFVQCNISFNKKKGTLRGMHFQKAPYEEEKLIRCTKGSIYDVVVDMRQHSPTYNKWEAIELNDENRNMLYVPAGFAHGFQTLEDNTEVFYQMSEFYYPEYAAGLRWDDPSFGIKWPIEQLIISPKDNSWKRIEEYR